ncbi:hypothetical protein PPYR_11131 [Photinus pyralis]|uniref:Uncharacterized protein n=1 Tax=Photinus pyralis TaxID=7054 RepID=A0A5N4AAE4_PHOPY|nr:uncharacterized protein LOC116176633 [Photinus pyralis]KAB0794292.1 hypothetical protein PPYR_11131 [Photinus pyralis]
MEKTDHYRRRKMCLQQSLAPTISQVKNELGNDLAEMIFSTCPKSVQPVLGLAPPLKGPGDDLWTSPSDILLGKVCLKPPLTGKCMKALTHQGILVIGQDIEMKFWNEAELDKKKELREQEEILKFMAELQQKKAVDKALELQEERLKFEKDQLTIQFSRHLERELDRLQRTLKTEHEHTLRIRQRDLNEEWQDKMERAVADSVKELTANFLKELELEGNLLYRKFQLEIKKEKLKHQFELHDVRKGCQESFAQLKHQLECKNIANIMYILCAERQKCQTERMAIEDKYQTEIGYLQSVITNQDEAYTELMKDREKKADQLTQREECLKEILRQFQKFINFALRSPPTQAEFLLDVEKLSLFALEGNVTDKDGYKESDTWKSDGERSENSPSTEVNGEFTSEACETNGSVIPHEEKPKPVESLPTLHYNKHTYIREGFEDVAACEIQNGECTENEKDDAGHDTQQSQEQESIASIQDEVTNSTTMKKIPKKSSILFSEHKAHESEDLICPVYDELPTDILEDATLQLEELSKVTVYKQQSMFEDVQKTCCSRCTQTYIETNRTALAEKVQKRISEALSSTLQIPYRESLIKYRTSIEKDEDERIEISRLSLARDSYLINKHSIAVKRLSTPNSECSLPRDDETSQVQETKHADKSKMSPKVSKLSVSKNSLELLRSQSMLSRSKPSESNESFEIEIESDHDFSLNESKAVKVSHFEVLTLYDKPKKQDGNTVKNLTATDSPWLTYGYKTKDEPQEQRTESTNKIIGDRDLEVHTQAPEDFIQHRAKSMLTIFKKHPSLIRLFTACTN